MIPKNKFDENGMLILNNIDNAPEIKVAKRGRRGYTIQRNGKLTYICGSCHKTIGSRPDDSCTNEKHWDLYKRKHNGKIPPKRIIKNR